MSDIPIPIPPRMAHPKCKRDLKDCRITMTAEVLPTVQAAEQKFDGHGQAVEPLIPTWASVYRCSTCNAEWKIIRGAGQEQVETQREPD